MIARTVPTGHLDRPVEVVADGDRWIVRKTYRAGGAAEVYDRMRTLWDSTLAGRMPEPLGLDLVAGAITMSYVAGPALGARGDVGDTGPRLAEVVEVLAALHAAPLVVTRRRSADRLVRSLRRKADDLAHRPGVGEAFARTVDLVARAAPEREDLVVSHGDFSPRNLLVAGHGLVLIDFDRLQMAGATRDLAYLGAWCWATAAMAGGAADWSLGAAAVEAYRELVGGESVGRGWGFHAGAALLRIAHGWSSLASDDDLAAAVIAEAARICHTPGVG